MNKVLIFTLGAAAGSLLTWKLLEQKYKQIADEEIEAVREYYKNKNEAVEQNVGNYIKEDEDDEKIEYASHVSDLGYSSNEHEVYIEPGVEIIAPYVISPNEYGENDYDTKSWTYYADRILTDEDNMIVGDPESIIGDALSHFGEYEEDSVFVRNDNTECDYEILRHEKTFSEINEVEY